MSTLDIRMLAPQRGVSLTGPAVHQFITRARELHRGVDLVGTRDYRVPA